ncbi:MAG: hypothetical protein ACR2J8_12470 [Thermomicrobiales bacterium]
MNHRRIRRFRAARQLVVCLAFSASALLAGQARAQAPTQDADLPGVQGRLYESPGYGFAVAWDPDIWTAIDAVSEETETGPYDMLTLDRDDAMIVIQAWTPEKSGFLADARGCVEEELAYLQDLDGLSGFTVVEPAQEMPGAMGFGQIGRWRADSTEPDGTAQTIDIGIECAESSLDGATWMHREVRFALNLDPGAPWPDPFAAYGYHTVSGGAGAALDIRVEAVPDQPRRESVIRFEVENLDDVPAIFDLSMISMTAMGEEVSPTGYRVDEATAPEEAGAFTLGPGDRITVTLTFPANMETVEGFAYLVDGEPVSLTPCWGGCGAGLLPIIRLSE